MTSRMSYVEKDGGACGGGIKALVKGGVDGKVWSEKLVTMFALGGKIGDEVTVEEAGFCNLNLCLDGLM